MLFKFFFPILFFVNLVNGEQLSSLSNKAFCYTQKITKCAI